MWGRYDAGRLVAGCHVGANLVPVECSPDDARAFGERALTRPRSVVTIVGLQDQVWPLWDIVSERWGPARETRWDQPHWIGRRAAGRARPRRSVARRPTTSPPSTRPAWRCTPRRSASTPRPTVVPRSTGPGSASSSGWLVLRPDRGRPRGVQGRGRPRHAPRGSGPGGLGAPDRRGEGLAAAWCRRRGGACRRDIAPVVSLYANIWNEPALRAYGGWGSTRPGPSPPSCSGAGFGAPHREGASSETASPGREARP